MKDYESLSHTRWECKYHVVFVPKYRKKILYGQVRRYVGEVLKDLAKQKGLKVEEGHLCRDHVHMMISIPPKYSVSMMVGFLKGKSAIRLHQKFGKTRGSGKSFWARGYFVSTVGLNEAQIRRYIQNQEDSDREEDDSGDKLDLGW